MTTITLEDVNNFSSKRLINLYTTFINPHKDTSYHRYIMEAYNVPESSFYNVIAGRRQTNRVVDAFRQEMIKKIQQSDSGSVVIQLNDLEEQSDRLDSSPDYLPYQKSPKKRKRKMSPSSKAAACAARSPKRKRARLHVSHMFTPQSPHEEEQVALQAYKRSNRRASTSRRSLFGASAQKDTKKKSGESFTWEEEQITLSESSSMDFDSATSSVDENSIDDTLEAEITLTEEKKQQIQDMVSRFKQNEMQKILSYRVSCSATFQDFEKEIAKTSRKSKRKNLPTRSLRF